ncbi:hypothetical protein JW898_03280 [Candidatus Woesearchaeota archaeon]|nr:hypothetical protein [Candidatus Woesearchaeota archaeon]
MDSEDAEDKMNVYVLGVSSFCSGLPFFPSFVLQYGADYLLVDPTANLSSAIRLCNKVSGSRLSMADIDACFISHIHSDHSSGAIDFAISKYYKEAKRGNRRPQFLGPAEVVDACWDLVLKGTLGVTFGSAVPDYQEIGLGFDSFFRRVELGVDGSPTRVGGLEVMLRKGIHAVKGGSYASKFRWNGVTVGYSGDTAPNMNGNDVPDVLEFLADDCDMIIYEVGGSHPVEGHTPLAILRSRIADYLSADDAARKVFLIHYPDSFLNEPLQVIPFQLIQPWHCYTVSRGRVEVGEPTPKGRNLLKAIMSD